MLHTNNTTATTTANSFSATEKRVMSRDYKKSVDCKIRSFSAYLNELKSDIDAMNIDYLKDAERLTKEATKTDKSEEAKRAAKEASERVKAAEAYKAANEKRVKDARAAFSSRITIEDITPRFLRDWLPQAFNEDGKICDLKRVSLEDEKEVRENYAASSLREIDGNLFILKPVELWSASKILSKFAKAASARAKAASEASAAERQAAKAAKDAKIEEAILAKAAEIQAKRAAKEASESEAEAK